MSSDFKCDEIQVGLRIMHPLGIHGLGELVQIKQCDNSGGGMHVLVLFSDGATIWLKKNEIKRVPKENKCYNFGKQKNK